MKQNKIPQATAKRLPLYYRFLNNLYQQGKKRVSSKELSEAVKVDSATIEGTLLTLAPLAKRDMDITLSICSVFSETHWISMKLLKWR